MAETGTTANIAHFAIYGHITRSRALTNRSVVIKEETATIMTDNVIVSLPAFHARDSDRRGAFLNQTFVSFCKSTRVHSRAINLAGSRTIAYHTTLFVRMNDYATTAGRDIDIRRTIFYQTFVLACDSTY